MVKSVVHVNQHNIRANAKGGEQAPVLTVKDYRANRKGNTAVIVVDGKAVGKFVYRPDNPLPCGAKVWFETEHEVVVI